MKQEIPKLAFLLLLAGCRSVHEEEPSARASAPAVDAASAARPGAAGLGDPYYPGLGNGGYDVSHYDLVLDFDVATGVLEARARVSATADFTLSRFNLELYGLDVERVSVNGVEAEYERDGRELVIQPAEALEEEGEFVVEVHYGGVPEAVPDPGVPFVPGVGWLRTSSGIYVMSECIGAASWFPCNDHPLDKATFSFTVTVDAPYVVAANGLLIEETDVGGARTYVWRASDPMATYLATVAIAELDVQVDEGPHGLVLRTYSPLDSSEDELAPFERTGEMIEFFEERFGPYPFECFGAIISYEELGGALETQTIPVYGRGAGEETVAHELAHQWFGDCVSPESWQDLWLNEGFASYAEFLWFEHVEGPDAAEARLRAMYRLLRRSDVGPPADPGVENLFGLGVYVRAPFVLWALRREVGDELFFRILTTWVEKNHDAHGSTVEFVRHCEDEMGSEVPVLFEDLLYAPEMPEIEELEVEAAGD